MPMRKRRNADPHLRATHALGSAACLLQMQGDAARARKDADSGID
jgi:hypothetical protein